MNILRIHNVCTAQAKRLKKHQEMISKTFENKLDMFDF